MPRHGKTNTLADVEAKLGVFRGLLEGLSDGPVPSVVVPPLSDHVLEERFAKRMAAVEGLRSWTLWADNGCPPIPNPYDTSISKRQWEILVGQVKIVCLRRTYRKLGVTAISDSIPYAVAGRPLLPDCLDESIDDDEWNELITIACQLLDASYAASVTCNNQTRENVRSDGLD